jgi:uncharacterized UBP type Zn finger protein
MEIIKKCQNSNHRINKEIQRHIKKILEKCKRIANIFYKKKENISTNTKNYEECEKEHLLTVALRMCLTCGYVGCWDSSIGKHATKHFEKIRAIRLRKQFQEIFGKGVIFMKNIINSSHK